VDGEKNRKTCSKSMPKKTKKSKREKNKRAVINERKNYVLTVSVYQDRVE
jgi:hypothetical protein